MASVWACWLFFSLLPNLFEQVDSTYFRGGVISWRPTGISNQVRDTLSDGKMFLNVKVNEFIKNKIFYLKVTCTS